MTDSEERPKSYLYWFNKEQEFRNLIDSNTAFLIRQYCNKYELDNKFQDKIKYEINMGLNIQNLITYQKEARLDLKEEAEKIEDALSILLESNRLGYDEPFNNDGWIQMVTRQQSLIHDLKTLSQEKINTSNIFNLIAEYPNLNKRVILAAFNQQLSLKVIPSELVILFKEWVTKHLGANNKETAITKETRLLIAKIFFNTSEKEDEEILNLISKRDLKNYENSYQLISIYNNLF